MRSEFLKKLEIERGTPSFNMTRPSIKVGVHDGNHHADDILAISLLQTLYSDFDFLITRTRDEAMLAKCDIVIDVGRRYDGVKYFDHHHDANLKCSVSLLWEAIVKDEFPFEYEFINELVLDAVSDLDTDMGRANEIRGDNTAYYNINALLFDMNILDGNEGFESALLIGRLFWKAILKKAHRQKQESVYIDFAQQVNPETIFVSEGISVNSHKKQLTAMGVKFVIIPHLHTTRFVLSSVDSRKFPLVIEKMVNPYFFHNSAFMAIFNDFDSAVQSAVQMMEKKSKQKA